METTIDDGAAGACVQQRDLVRPDTTVNARIYAIHHSAPVFLSPVRAFEFGRERWGQVDVFEQVVESRPMGAGLPFEDSAEYRALRNVFVRGERWETTEWFKRNLKFIEAGEVLWNCHDRQEWMHRLDNDVRALYESIRKHGFLEQEAIAERARSNAGEFGQFVRDDYPSTVGVNHEIKLGINEDGKLLFLDGRHRLAIAKLLRIERIPVRIVFVHHDFMARQSGWPPAASELAGDTRFESLSRIIDAHLRSARRAAAQRVHYLTPDEFASGVTSAGTDRGKAAAARWEYHRSAIDFVRLCRPRAGSEVLEMRAAGVSIVHGSDTFDLAGRNGQSGEEPEAAHDAREVPWPVEDKRYQVFVALRVFHQLAPRQRECFLEARRVADNIVMVVPDHEDLIEGSAPAAGVSEAQFIEWNDGVGPTVSVRLPGRAGRLYFWNKEALRG